MDEIDNIRDYFHYALSIAPGFAHNERVYLVIPPGVIKSVHVDPFTSLCLKFIDIKKMKK